MTDDFTRRNHYLPKEYQRGFAGEDGRVWVFDRGTSKFRQAHPVNVCVERDFYTTVDAAGKPQDIVEKGVFTAIEGRTWAAMERLRCGAEGLSSDERADLSLFVSLMRTRVPAFDKTHDNSVELLSRWMAKAFNPNPEALASRLSETTGQSRTPDEPEVQQLFGMIHKDEYEIEIPRQIAIKAMLNIAVELAEGIRAMDWTVLHSPTDCLFITSDNPLVVLPPEGHDLELLGYGPLTPGATNLFPLDKTMLLRMGSDGVAPIRHHKVDRERIRIANELIAANSDRFVLARDEAHIRSVVKRTGIDRWRNSSHQI